MRYLGSKRRIAKAIAAVINPVRGDLPIWEPFCGGLGATFAFGGSVVASDANASLIALYKAVQVRGVDWLPRQVSQQEREDALSRSDDDPVKAFMRIGCGFGGDWNGGYARNDAKNDYCLQTINSLRKIVDSSVQFAHINFLDIDPSPEMVLYLDPPYRGTTGYAAAFDFDAFDRRVLSWAAAGAAVFVSEYALPYGLCVWSADLAQMNGKQRKVSEKLYLVTT